MDNKPVIPLTAIRPVAAATIDDVRATLDGLPSGVYPAADLYKRYAALMESQGRDPVNPSQLGRMLSEWGALRKRITPVKNGPQVNAWLI